MAFLRAALGGVLCLLLFAGLVMAQTVDAPTLIARLSDKKKTTRLDALKQLGKLGTAGKIAVPDIVQLVRDTSDKDEIIQGTTALAMIGPAAASELARLLKDGRQEHPRQAAIALSRMGPAAAKVQPQLRAALKDPDPIVRRHAAQALGELRDMDEESITSLFDMVTDPNLGARQQAGLVLLRAGKKAVPGLLEVYRSESKGLARVEAAGLLGRIGPEAEEAVSDLITGLRDSQPIIRAGSAHALAGVKSKDALPALLKTMADESNYDVQRNLFVALTSISSRDMPGFLDEVKRINEQGEWAAPFVLARFGPRGVDAVKPLIKTLRDADPGMRLGAALALGQIGPDAKEAIPYLNLTLKDPLPPIRGAAAQSLLRIDPRTGIHAQEQLFQAVEQIQFHLTKIKADLARSTLPRGGIWTARDRAVFKDPGVQSSLKQLMNLNLFANSITMGKIKVDATTKAKWRAAQNETIALLESVGPASIPVYVYGINKASEFKLGFC